MQLSVRLVGKNAKLMRGKTEIGGIKLDHYWQIAEVTITATATPEEDEKIIRLAASHAAQFVVDRRIDHASGHRQETIQPYPGSTPERSRRLLDFGMIAPHHTKLSLRYLELALRRIGVKIERHER